MKNIRIAFAAMAAVIVWFGCTKTDNELVNLNEQNRLSTTAGENKPYREGELILGKKLINPYTVENMQKAAKTLNSEGLTQLDPSKIKASHYYVKFMPADSTQFEALDADKSLTLYPYPLDYEIIQSGNHYRDPSTPRGGFAYQYASVRTDYVFPKVPYEVIGALYIPEEDIQFKSEENDDLLDRLLDRAYILTGNFQDTIKTEKGTSEKKHPYNPGGKIQIFDTRLNQLIGLEGVDMRARRWFTTHHARTDFNGDYEMDDDFKRPCNYSLWFSQEDFMVKPHLIDLTAWIDGPKKEGDWNYNINSGYDRFVGHIFRGAYRYHYGFIDGLKRPYRLLLRIKYIAKNGGGSSGNNLVPLPIIKIARYDQYNNEYDSDEIFSTTVHETAHSSHVLRMDLLAISYWTVSYWLQESWAMGVEWWITKLEYKNTRGIPNYGDWNYLVPVERPNSQGYQYWTHNYDWKYTNVYINLIDDYNESQGIWTVDDNVKGYTLADIESNMLRNIFTFETLKEQLKENKPNGVTDANIDILLSYY